MAGLTATGYIARTAGEWYSRAQAQYESIVAALGLSLPTWSRFEFVSAVAAILAQIASEIDDAVATIVDAWDPNQASGSTLRQLAELGAVQIFDGTPSRATLTCSAWSIGSVFLSKGTRAGDGTYSWALKEDLTIPAGGTADGVFEVVDEDGVALPGPITATAGTITERVDGVAGWTAVTNAAAAVPGLAADTDAQIRAKVYQGNSGGGSYSPRAIRAALLAVPGVQYATLHYDTTGASTTVSGRTIPAFGVGVWIYPDTLTDAEKLTAISYLYARLAANIPRSLPSATGVDGVLANIEDAGGGTQQEGFWWIQDTEHWVKVTINTYEGNGTLETVTESVKAVVRDYFALLGPGEAVRQQDILGAVVLVDGVARATVQISDVSAVSGFDQLDRTIGAGSVAVLSSDATTDVVVD